MKKLMALLLGATLMFTLVGCIGCQVESTDTVIALEGDSISLHGKGATVEGSIVVVWSAGTYIINGTLDDGQIMVNTGAAETVNLVLNGANIACSTSAPVYVVNAEETVITLVEGTENLITDGDSYVFADAASDEPSAAIFSKDDLTINGSGSLTVNANYNNGIQSKDDLQIAGGSITVNAENDAIKGKDSIAVTGGTITVKAGGDGVQSNNDVDPKKGHVSIKGGTLNISATADGIQAETSVLIGGGNITISSGGGSTKTVDPADSAKAIKAVVDVTIDGGTINIDSSDDSLHSDGSLTINGGSIIVASGDDGIHSDATVKINGGDIRITKCFEAIESAVVTVNDGNVHLVASDDGVNIVAGVDGFAGNNHLDINGGYVAIDAGGDGVDVKGSVNMTGGSLVINGPVRTKGSALHYDGTFKMTGGLLIAAGSSGTAQATSASSTQCSVILSLSSSKAAGTMVHIQTQDGQDILTFAPTKAYQSVVLCSPGLQSGSAYVVYSGGSSTGSVIDGLYSGGTYIAGTQVASFTVSSMVTAV